MPPQGRRRGTGSNRGGGGGGWQDEANTACAVIGFPHSRCGYLVLSGLPVTRPPSFTVESIYLIPKRLLWALAIGHWEAIVWRSLKHSIALFSYAQIKYPMPTCQSIAKATFIELGMFSAQSNLIAQQAWPTITHIYSSF